jgi:hypothetical protein
MTPEILSSLENARKDLLDLGMRNPLLNHRIKAKQINIRGNHVSAVFNALVNLEKRLTFSARLESPPSKADLLRHRVLENVSDRLRVVSGE